MSIVPELVSVHEIQQTMTTWPDGVSQKHVTFEVTFTIRIPGAPDIPRTSRSTGQMIRPDQLAIRFTRSATTPGWRAGEPFIRGHLVLKTGGISDATPCHRRLFRDETEQFPWLGELIGQCRPGRGELEV